MNNWISAFVLLATSFNAFAQTNAHTMEQRMKRVMIPSIEFRQADAIQALNFLVEASAGVSPEAPICLGLINTNIPPTSPEKYILQLEDGSDLDLPALNVRYHRISLYDAVVKITEHLGLRFRFENDNLVLFTQDGQRIIRNILSNGLESTGAPPGAGTPETHP